MALLYRFLYEDLNYELNQIRLFRFKRTLSTFIECELRHYDFEDHPAYTALSYTWEPRYPLREIVINGQKMTIGNNLWQFLETVRHNYESFFWVDQVCINQRSTEERNHQVSFMDYIYHYAHEVNIWLGVESCNSGPAMDFIHSTSLNAVKAPAHSWTCQADFSPDVKKGTSYYAHTTLKIDLGTMIALKKIFQRRYWNRLWVIQEIMFARQVILRCGNRTMGWENLQAFQDWARLNRNVTVIEFHRVSDILPMNVRAILNTKRVWGLGAAWKKPEQGLRHVLPAYKNFECENILDKVYGLLGLITGNEKVEVNYEESKDTLFINVMKVALNDEHMTLAGLVEFSIVLWATMCGRRCSGFVKALASAGINAENEMYMESIEAPISRQRHFTHAELLSEVEMYGIARFWLSELDMGGEEWYQDYQRERLAFQRGQDSWKVRRRTLRENLSGNTDEKRAKSRWKRERRIEIP